MHQQNIIDPCITWHKGDTYSTYGSGICTCVLKVCIFAVIESEVACILYNVSEGLTLKEVRLTGAWKAMLITSVGPEPMGAPAMTAMAERMNAMSFMGS